MPVNTLAAQLHPEYHRSVTHRTTGCSTVNSTNTSKETQMPESTKDNAKAPDYGKEAVAQKQDAMLQL